MAVKNFEDLNIWKQARQLTQEVYRLTETEKFLKDFGLRDQIRRAAILRESDMKGEKFIRSKPVLR